MHSMEFLKLSDDMKTKSNGGGIDIFSVLIFLFDEPSSGGAGDSRDEEADG